MKLAFSSQWKNVSEAELSSTRFQTKYKKMKLNKKKIQKEYAQKSITQYFSLLKYKQYNKYYSKYIKEIQKLSQTFNIRLKKEEKLQYCKKCLTPWNSKTKQIRLNPLNSCIEHICLNCSFTRRYKYK